MSRLARYFLPLLFVSIVEGGSSDRHFIVLDPGHSHAAAVFASDHPGLSSDVYVFAPKGPEANAFLQSISAFNRRSENPTHWTPKAFLTPDFLAGMLREAPGNIVVITGRNNQKISQIESSLRIGQNVLADKPWIIESKDLPRLDSALTLAEQSHLIAYDCMTERFNIAYQIQRELMRDPDVFGHPLTGSASSPAVLLQNLHSLVKLSGGKVNLRPAWFFDVRQQGEAIADVGTHLVDLEIWSLFPGQALDYRRDIRVVNADRSPVSLSLPQFQRVTGDSTWPPFLQDNVRNDHLEYDCNNRALFTIRGIYTAISDRWEYESAGALNDTYLVLYRGTRATIRVMQSKLENYVAEIDVIPNPAQDRASLQAALQRRMNTLSPTFPNLSLRDNGQNMRVVIPPEDRDLRGSTFDQLVNRFLSYVQDPATLPAWEKPNMLAKYYVTTKAVELARKSPVSQAH